MPLIISWCISSDGLLVIAYLLLTILSARKCWWHWSVGAEVAGQICEEPGKTAGIPIEALILSQEIWGGECSKDRETPGFYGTALHCSKLHVARTCPSHLVSARSFGQHALSDEQRGLRWAARSAIANSFTMEGIAPPKEQLVRLDDNRSDRS